MDVKKLFEDHKARFTALYGDRDACGRYEKLAQQFRSRFAGEPEVFVSAPGRTEIAGNHTDHNFGRVLAAAVDLDTVAAASAVDGSVVTLYSDGFDGVFRVDISDTSVHEDEKETTSSLIRGVAAKLRELGYKVGGFNACVNSTVFKGSGLSSSAAFEVMLTAVFDALYNGWTIDPVLNARVSQYAENVYFGKPSGLMDQTASAVGGFVAIDFKGGDANVEAVPFDFASKGFTVCVVSVGGEHGNLTAEYGAIPTEMKLVAGKFGKATLSEVSPEELMRGVPMLKRDPDVTDRAILRAFHFEDETERARLAARALSDDDIGTFLQLIIESGESSWMLLQNLHVEKSDNQEMPLALELSRRVLKGRGAWRIHGGGFAGTILAFIPNALVDEYIGVLDGVFGRGACTPLAIRPEGVAYFR